MIKSLLKAFFAYFLVTFTTLAKEEDTVTLSINCEDVEVLYSEKGIVRYKLESKEIKKSEDDAIVLPGGGTLTCYDKEGKIEFVAYAKNAHCTSDKKKWSFEGDVLIETTKVRLETKNLNWYRDEKLIFTDDIVHIVTADSSLQGEGLVANQDLSNYKINKPKGAITVD